MSSILRAKGTSTNVPINYYEADTERDMYEIDIFGVPMGSECYVINAGTKYKLNSEGIWKPVPSGGGYDPSNHYIWDGGNASGGWT